MTSDDGCMARSFKRCSPVCGEPTDTTRKVQAAPGLWIHVKLCHFHQHHWDEGEQWGGPNVLRETPCLSRKNSSCRKG